jgi:hypothetical protein
MENKIDTAGLICCIFAFLPALREGTQVASFLPVTRHLISLNTVIARRDDEAICCFK